MKEWILDKWETSKDWVMDRKDERTSLDGVALIAMGVIALFFTPFVKFAAYGAIIYGCLLYTSPSPRDLSTSRMPSSA